MKDLQTKRPSKQDLMEDLTANLDTVVKALAQFWENHYITADPPEDILLDYRIAAPELETIIFALGAISQALQAVTSEPSPQFRAYLEALLDPAAE